MVKMLTEEGKIYKTCLKWCPFILTQAWSRFLHSLMAPSMTVCPKSDQYIKQVLFQLVAQTLVCTSALVVMTTVAAGTLLCE